MGPMGPMGMGPMGSMPIGHGGGGAVGAPYPVDAAPVSEFAGDLGAAYYDPPSSFGTERIWISGHYLLGYLSRPGLATPLVVTGSPTDLHPGALGQPGTAVLFGADQYQFNPLSGVQVDLGVNLNDRLYLEATAKYFFPQHTNALYLSDAAGSPFIGRPVFNTLFGQERAYLTSSPGISSGSTNVQSRLQIFSLEAHARYQVNLTPYLSADFLLGVRRLQLEEELQITDVLLPIGGSITFLGAPVTAPNTVSDFDRFATVNQFNGVNTGLRFRWQSGLPYFALSGYGKLAVGQTRQTVEIEGVSGTTAPAGQPTAIGGLLALPSNIGFHERKVFGIVPEGGAQAIFLLAPGVRFYMGYTATYWNSVVRPGDQIDRRVDPRTIPTDLNFSPTATSTVPAFEFRDRAVWLQTINFGFEFYY
jgi:putative beta barrel porin BBP7